MHSPVSLNSKLLLMEEFMMKTGYTNPEIEIIVFESEDVITVSLTDGGNSPDYGKGGDTIGF